MQINYEIYKYRFAGGELELGGLPLKPKAALETVLIEDYLREHKFRFANARCKTDYIREYMWIPEPDGVVTVFKFGYQRHTSEDKSHWSLRRKMEFPHCVIVVSHRESSPFILIWGYEKAFKSANEVAELLGNALNSSFRGRGISINLSPCGDDEEADHWMKYMVKTYQKAKGHKNSTDRRLKDYERIKLCSRWDRYLGMTAAMTQVPVPTATHGYYWSALRTTATRLASLEWVRTRSIWRNHTFIGETRTRRDGSIEQNDR